MRKGIVIKSTGSWYSVKDQEDGSIQSCRIIGKFRLNGMKLTNPVAVGDTVEYELEEAGEGALIKKIASRENYIVRQSPRKKHQLHLLASNIDLAIVVVTIREPKLKQGFIDRFILMCEPHNVPVLIVFNKSDLYTEEDMSLFAYLSHLYAEIGYDVALCSSFTGTGIQEISDYISGKISLICGQSGVGKSTLINQLLPDLNLKTSSLSDYSGKGQHTTTFAEMHWMNKSTAIIDTPGIKTLSFNNLEPMDVAHNFREFFEESPNCRFGDCSHRNEPGCAVKEAIEAGEISELRYFNYIQILEEIEDQNYWERHGDM